MDREDEPRRPRGRHLLPTDKEGRLAEVARDVDLTRAHGQGNGVRVHLIYFGLVSLAVLVLIIVAIAVAGMTGMM